MMVSKIAVIALVAVISVPILLGYALNLTETTETDYRDTGESVNVTQLLQNNTAYAFTHADPYKLNTDQSAIPANYPYTDLAKYYPIFETVSSNTTSFKATTAIYYNASNNGGSHSFSGYSWWFCMLDYDYHITGQNLVVNTYHEGLSATVTVQQIHSYYYDGSTHQLDYTRYTNSGTLATGTINNVVSVNYYVTNVTSYNVYDDNGLAGYIDISAGYHFIGHPTEYQINTPDARSVLLTIDLDSITDANYDMYIDTGNIRYKLVKTTTGSDVSWRIETGGDKIDLYYNPLGNNTYQLKFDLIELYESGGNFYYDSHIEARYVGAWPSLIGEANYYWSGELTNSAGYSANTQYIQYLRFSNVYPSTIDRTPTMRLDDAFVRSFLYNVIENKEYNPASFKTNPKTTIGNVSQYGTSLIFGGNTYTVIKDSISLDGRLIPIKGLTFSSVPNGAGTYDNKIGNTVISTSAVPSTITFSGQWSINVSTISQESYNYTKTEWHAGEFGWDGVDQNFLMVGLITCLAVFIGLGIYARKSRSGGIIPLMIVTGCAAAVFFIML